MARTVYHSHGTKAEQLFHEDVMIEAISHYGQNFYYIPRTLVAKDEILGEDRLSRFKHAYGIEMYMENAEGFEGQGAFIQKFGLMMEYTATLTVARRRWDQLVGRYGSTIIPNRPCEGDLLYFPLTDALFEIKFIMDKDPFYPIGGLFVYRLQVEHFQYASERLDTGVPNIDDFETLKTYDVAVIKNGTVKEINVTQGGYAYVNIPTVTLGTDWSAGQTVYAGEEICASNRRYIVTTAGTLGTTVPGHTSGIVQNGTAQLQYFGIRATAKAILGSGDSVGAVVSVVVTDPGSGYTLPPSVHFSVIGSGNGAQATAVIENLDTQDSYGDNNKFKAEAVEILYQESNPFGMLEGGFEISPAISADSTAIYSDSTTLTVDTN